MPWTKKTEQIFRNKNKNIEQKRPFLSAAKTEAEFEHTDEKEDMRSRTCQRRFVECKLFTKKVLDCPAVEKLLEE